MTIFRMLLVIRDAAVDSLTIVSGSGSVVHDNA